MATWPMSQDYNEAIQHPEDCFTDPELRQGEAVTNRLGLPVPCSGNFADVYAMTSGPRKWAVKCFTRQIPGLKERYVEVSKYLQQVSLPFMVDFRFLEQGIRVRGQWFPILKMQWVEGLALNTFVHDNLDKPQVLDGLCQIWLKLAVRLREANLAHCDLQHGNVLLVQGAKAGTLGVRLVDYDGMCVPALELLKSIELGHPNFQHPQRIREQLYGMEVDRFSHLVIYTALRALIAGGKELWQKYDNGDNLLFKQTDFEASNKSPLFADLLRIKDPVVVGLTRHLIDATRRPLEQTPLLETLIGNGRAEENRKTGTRGTVGVEVPIAQLVASPAALFATGTAGIGIARRQRPRSRAGAWAIGAAALAAAVTGTVFIATTSRTDETASGPEVAQNVAITSRLETNPTRKLPAASRSINPRSEPKAHVTRQLLRTEPKTEPNKEPPPAPKIDPPKLKPEPKETLVDLLPLIDPQKHAVRGSWKLEEGALVSDATVGAILEIPFAPPDEYDFRIVFTRQIGNENVCQFLSHADCRFNWLMAGWGNKVLGFEQIGGKAADANPTTVRVNTCLENGRQYTSEVQVRKDNVAAFLDGKLISEWKTDYKDMGRAYLWVAPGGMLLGLGSWQSPTVFHRVELRLVNGSVKPSPVPASEAQTKTEKIIKNLYKDDFDKAMTHSQTRIALADKLLEQAWKTNDDLVGRYVLYREALDLTARAADSAMTYQIVDILAKEYVIDAPALRTAALEKAAKAASTVASKRTLLEVIGRVIEEATREDAFELVEKLLKTADGVLVDRKDKRLPGPLETRKRQLTRLRGEFETVRKALDTLAKTPHDPDANLAVGKYQCLWKGNWNKGLPFLARSGSKKLHDLAKIDLSQPTVPSSRATVGDGWWDLAESEKGASPTRMHLLRRALRWYRKALPGLTGLSRTKVEKRLAELEQDPSIQPPSAFLPLPLDQVATAASTRPMFNNIPNDTLVLPKWGAQEVFKVPFVVADPKRGKVKNVLVFRGPLGTVSRRMPQTVRLPCGSSAQAIHLLGGVSGWGFPVITGRSASLTVRLHYENGLTEDHPLLNGLHLANYNARSDVAESRLAYQIAHKQVRYLSIQPKRLTPIREIEFIKGKDNTAPVILGVTIEQPNWHEQR